MTAPRASFAVILGPPKGRAQQWPGCPVPACGDSLPSPWTWNTRETLFKIQAGAAWGGTEKMLSLTCQNDIGGLAAPVRLRRAGPGRDRAAGSRGDRTPRGASQPLLGPHVDAHILFQDPSATGQRARPGPAAPQPGEKPRGAHRGWLWPEFWRPGASLAFAAGEEPPRRPGTCLGVAEAFPAQGSPWAPRMGPAPRAGSSLAGRASPSQGSASVDRALQPASED